MIATEVGTAVLRLCFAGVVLVLTTTVLAYAWGAARRFSPLPRIDWRSWLYIAFGVLSVARLAVIAEAVLQ